MSTHNIGFYEEMSKIIIIYHQICSLFFLLLHILQHCLGVMGFIAVIVNVALIGVSGQVEKVAPNLDSSYIFFIIVSIEVSQRYQ